MKKSNETTELCIENYVTIKGNKYRIWLYSYKGSMTTKVEDENGDTLFSVEGTLDKGNISLQIEDKNYHVLSY